MAPVHDQIPRFRIQDQEDDDKRQVASLCDQSAPKIKETKAPTSSRQLEQAIQLPQTVRVRNLQREKR